MAYATKYRIDFSNQLSEDYYVFLNLKDYVGDVQFITGTAAVLTIKSINDDDDRFSPILSKECAINMYISEKQNISIDNFLAIEDDQWNVLVYRDLNQPPIFNGFVVVEDSSQPFHDQPYSLSIRASDGLALLKGVELQTIQGNDFEGLNNITDYLGAILYYLNPAINFRVYYDIFHVEMNAAVSPLEQVQVNAGTFDKDETTFEDCYTVLEKICTDFQCRIFYENGCWHIVSLWQYRKTSGFNWMEYSTNLGYVHLENFNNNDYQVAKIGKDGELIYLVQKDAFRYPKLATKSVKKQFDYIIPRELVKNQQFNIGAIIPGLSGNFLDTSVSPSQTVYYDGYTIPGWTQQRAVASVGPAIVNPAYIKRERDVYDYEKDRYVVLPTQTSAPTTIFLLSSEFDIGQSDRINISIDSKIKNHYGGNQTSLVFAVLLRGDDGKFYTLDDNSVNDDGVQFPGKWYQAGSNFSTGIRVIQEYIPPEARKDEWRSTSVNSGSAPVSGKIQIVLYEQSGDAYPNETWYKNLRIEYKPYIKGGYAAVKGDYNIYSQELKLNRVVNEPVNISDSPKKIIKGSLFVNNNLASPQWKRPDDSKPYRFSQVMALTKYNFVFRQFQKIEGSIKGLSLLDTSGNNIPFGFLPQYSFTDLPGQLNTRYILTSMDVNYVSGIWRGVLVEVQINSSETFSKYDFQYLFE